VKTGQKKKLHDGLTVPSGRIDVPCSAARRPFGFAENAKKKLECSRYMRGVLEKNTALNYLTFWTVVSFSFFMATDEIIDTSNGRYDIANTDGAVMASVCVFRTLAHLFSLLSIAVAIAEAYHTIVRNVTSTARFLEFNSAIACTCTMACAIIDICHDLTLVRTPDPITFQTAFTIRILCLFAFAMVVFVQGRSMVIIFS
jgi:hypothetical protein